MIILIVLPVTLPAVVEFRSAMEQLGVITPDERIHFVRKHNVPVFIAPRPFVGLEHKDVRVRLYVFSHHSLLGSEEIFERHTGSQTLCLDATDYERLLEEYAPKTRSAYSVRIAELERNVIDVNAVNSLQSADIAKLTEEKKTLTARSFPASPPPWASNMSRIITDDEYATQRETCVQPFCPRCLVMGITERAGLQWEGEDKDTAIVHLTCNTCKVRWTEILRPVGYEME